MKTKIGTQVAHVMWLEHYFQGQNVKSQLTEAGHIVAASRIACLKFKHNSNLSTNLVAYTYMVLI